MIDFTKQTLSVPELPLSKEFNINQEMSVSVWIKTEHQNLAGNEEHIFTFPSIQDGANMVQMFTKPKNTYFYCNYKTAGFYDVRDQTTDWQHLVVTIVEDSMGVHVKLYVNGNFVSVKTSDANYLVPTGSNPQRGFVLGNDVDGVDINEVEQSFLGQITKFYLYDKILNDEEVKACFEHKEPVDNRIIWWEEIQGIETSNDDVQEKDYPQQFYF